MEDGKFIFTHIPGNILKVKISDKSIKYQPKVSFIYFRFIFNKKSEWLIYSDTMTRLNFIIVKESSMYLFIYVFIILDIWSTNILKSRTLFAVWLKVREL